MFENRRILVGITAGIAAYKSILLVRMLKKEGADVRVVLTPSALEFVTPLTLATLSGNPVISEFTVNKDSGEWSNHVDLGLWADLMVIAPTTANTLAKMVAGESDNFLLATYLSAKCDVCFAPAMDLDMFAHPSTQENISKLVERGDTLIPAGTGALASGLSGEGRMAEPEQIVEAIRLKLNPETPLKGKKLLITAGPTHEAIDPVRFIGNRSTGQMGYRLAEEAAKLGMTVTLVSGPSNEVLTTEQVKLVKVTSAREMHDACMEVFTEQDVVIMSAAVADYTPSEVADNKIKKSEGDMKIELQRTQDILGAMGTQKKDSQVLVGFALETENELESAKGKLERKNLDLVVLNSLQDKGAGFGGDTNQITIIDKNNNISKFELKTKSEVAKDILGFVAQQYA